MAYLTEDLVAKSPVFRAKVEMALTKAVEAALSSTNVKTAAMARAVMQDVPRFAGDIAKLLALSGLDLDSLDSAIDDGIAANISWLIAKVGK